MHDEQRPNLDETLDPADWDAMRDLGHQMVDDLMTYLETVRERPVWRPIPDDVKASLDRKIPQDGQGAEAAYTDFVNNILPHPMGNIHPRFWGWVIGTGTPFGALAEMAAATMNPNMGGGDHVPVNVERQVLDWCKEMLGYPMDASGLLTSGGSMANFVGLTVARNAQAEFDIRIEGVHNAPRQMVFYASAEVHSSVTKAAELLGLGRNALRNVPVNADFEMDVNVLEGMISADKSAGHYPFCIVGTVGTVNTGATDDIHRLADIARREKMWLHIDGAFGAICAIGPETRHLADGIERADSIAFDLHKWMYMPIEVGCVLVRSEPAHRQAFSLTPEYLKHAERGVAGGSNWFTDYGLQLSRGFRALKVWLSLKEHGIQKYARLVHQNVQQATYLAELVAADAELELMAPAPMNIVCFRFNPGNLDDTQLDAVNEELLLRMHESGIAAPSSTILNGRYAIRVANTNHRSRRDDFDLLARETKRLGHEVLGDGD
jgi:glutamate/tyrosine decarboxylase-like PLP-dependent enzyme